MSRTARTIVLIVSVVCIVAAIGFVVLNRGDGTKARPGAGPRVVKGLVGSEKAPFFHDPDVIEAFADHGLRLEIDTAGSRSMLQADPQAYDFMFPSSAPVADELTSRIPGARPYAAFQTPLVVLTFADLVPVLQANGLVDDAGRFPVAAYLDLVNTDTRWNTLQDNTVYDNSKSVLVTTTDPLRSNSGLMFASLTGYVANGDRVLADSSQVAAAAPRIRPAFADQGYKQASSEGPFEDYLALGRQKTPLLLAYESQLLSRRIAGSPAVTDQMVTLYPEPGMFSKHVVVARSEDGARVGDLLTRDETLTALVARYGFHPQANPRAFDRALTDAGVDRPPPVDNAVEPSPYAVLDDLARAVSPDPDTGPAPSPVPGTEAPEVAP